MRSQAVKKSMGKCSLLIYDLSKYFPCEYIVSITSFKSHLIKHDVRLVNYGLH